MGPFLFSLMINDLTVKDPDNNLLVKFADDMTVSAPVKENYDTASAEVGNIEKWTEANRMSLNLTKTWRMIVSGKSANLPPEQIITRYRTKDMAETIGYYLSERSI